MNDAIIRRRRSSVALAALCAAAMLAGGCSASAPIRYHTLLGASESGQRVLPRADFFIDVQPVEIPAYVDRTRLVFRTENDGVTLAERERWIAPLADELRTALSTRIASDLGTVDVGGRFRAHERPVLHIRVVMRRFDSAPGRYVAEDAVWALRSDDGSIAVDGCAMHLRKMVQPAGESVVFGHRQLLGDLAILIADSARAAVAGRRRVCPGDN